MSESGCRLDHPAATKFKHHVMDGDWTKADHDLQELRPMLGANNNIMVSKVLMLDFQNTILFVFSIKYS